MENKYPLIGERVRDARLKNNLTQEVLSEKAGISQGFLGNIERGEGFPSLETIINLANALEVSADRLLFDYIHTHSMAEDDYVITALSKMTAEQILRLIVEASR